ncbi:MAG: HAD hydrolase-like protein [Oceanibaculum nanhaiense]|jgi:glycerol 3-phosphatase-2|uniref:HAD-IIA family hydrolase n=1 Tax=Oceanibaculum nanhaiense TaxID=1909734 RepID=UPI0032EF215C
MSFPVLGFDDAWSSYRRWEHRLPAKPVPVEPQRIAGIAEVLDQVDIVVLDAYGVLNLGSSVIPQGLAAVKAIRAAGKHLCVVTNDGSQGTAAIAAKHRGRGYDFRDDEVIAGASLVGEAVASFPEVRNWGIIAQDPRPEAAITGGMVTLDLDRAAYESVDGIVFMATEIWDEDRQALLSDALTVRPRPFIVANPDVVAPHVGGFSAEPGYFAHRIADRSGISPTFLGKPFGGVYRLVRERFPEVDPSRILAVGDTPHTDVIGARAHGMRALLVESGFLAGRDSLAFSRECGILPDLIAPTI